MALINILICLRYHNCIINTLFGLCFRFHLHQDMNPKLESVNKISQGFYLSNKDVSFVLNNKLNFFAYFYTP